MDMDALLDELQVGMNRRLSALPERIRPFTTSFTNLPRAISLTGPRGVGKTVFLLHHAVGKKILYISADSPLLAGVKLYSIIKQVFLAGYEGVIVDEVHFAKDWSISLKAIYDEYPDRILWISDSSSLILRGGTADLSRRFLQISMPLLSFREFLFLEYGNSYSPIEAFTNSSSYTDSFKVQPEPKILEAWQKYKQQGTRPFYSEGNFSERLIAIMEKSLYYDIPFLVPSITDNNLRLMSSVISTLAQSVIPRLHVSSLCADWGIGSDKLYQLIAAMEAVGLLRVIRYEQDKKAKTVGAKLFLADPALYMALGANTGTAREAMVAMFCTNSGWKVYASKDETKGDFIISRLHNGKVTRFLLEVGGSKKHKKSADFVIRDDIDLPGLTALPLWLLGMGW